jgi:hypothetical protein
LVLLLKEYYILLVNCNQIKKGLTHMLDPFFSL